MATPQQIAQKWAARLGQAGDAVRQGVEAVTVNPAEKAIEAQQRYVEGVQRAVADGKYEAGLRRVSLASWKESMLNKGLNRIASGAAAAQNKFATFMGELMPHIESGQRQLESQPRGSLEQNIARMVMFTQHMARFRRGQ